MKSKSDAVCRAIALPKKYDGELTTIFITREGRSVEHLLCAHVGDKKWLIHHGGSLDPDGLCEHEVKRNAKRQRSTLSPLCLGHIKQSASLDTLMAIAHFRAEVCRAQQDGREVDLKVAECRFEMNASNWESTPKTILALWDCDGGHHVDVIPFPKVRL